MLNKVRAAEKDAVKIRPFWQKKFAKYSHDDQAVPAELPFKASHVVGPLLSEGPMMVDSLPLADVRDICTTNDGAVWFGGPNGLIRYAPSEYRLDQVQYFSAGRYLRDNNVLALLPDGENGVWVRTSEGVSHIWYEKMSMDEKSDHYSKIVKERHRRHNFIADCIFEVPEDPTSKSHTYSADNDGLWTAMYAASACYEYAVTGSKDALERAVHATEGVLSLVDIVPIKGYLARSYVTRDERLPSDGFWLPTEDGKMLWKSDTSSDELVGHFLIYLLAHEFLPDENLRARIRTAAANIMDYIISNGYYLHDVTGKPTLWGNWSLDYFNGRGYEDTSVNCTELLSHMKVTAYITGEQRFIDEYHHLAYELGYADLCATYLERKEPTINYSDEELVYLSYLPLVLLEEDPVLREKYKKGMAEWWINIRRELNPLWTYIYKLIDPETDYDMEGCEWTLRRLPLDLIYYNSDVSSRADIVHEEALDRFGKENIKNLLAPDERRTMKWNTNPFELYSPANGTRQEAGTIFTLPYWLGRYHGFLIEE